MITPIDNNVPAPQQPAATPGWDGLTLEQLRFRRAMALVRREVGRERVSGMLDNVKSNVQQNGVRSLLFTPNTVKGLKWVDYALLGFKSFRLLSKLFGKKK